MPKSRKRKKAKSTGRVSAGSGVVQEEKTRVLPARASRSISFGVPGVQNIAFSAMIALGFWGLAIFCIFFYVADPDHYIYGAIMGVTAVGWMVIVARRWLAYRQRVS